MPRPLALAAVAALALSSCALARVVHDGWKPPRATLLRVHVDHLNHEGALLEATFRLHNPNPLGVSLSRTSYVFKLDSHRLFDGVLAGGLTLPANGDALLVVPVRVAFRNFKPIERELAEQEEAPYDVDVTASVLERRWTIPLHFAGRLPVPKRPKIHLAGARLEHLGLKHARLVLELRLRNPNPFVLPLTRFAGEALVDDHRLADVAFAGARPLAPRAEEVVELPVDVSLAAAGVAAVDRLVHRGTLRLRGTVEVGGRDVPVDLATSLAKHDRRDDGPRSRQVEHGRRR